MKVARRALLALAASGLAGCAAAPPAALPPEGGGHPGPGHPPPASHFRPLTLPGSNGHWLQALERGARSAPLRYRVIVIPGSGCAGMGAMAERYFAGLLHAQVLVLHKPGVAPEARTPPGHCPPDFVQADALDQWQAHAAAALQHWLARQAPPALPTLLVGISEGGELLPGLAASLQQPVSQPAPQPAPPLAGLVLLSASGLDPREAGALQAARTGHSAAWQQLEQQAQQVQQWKQQLEPPPAPALGRSTGPARLLQGRSQRYWQVLWRWPVAQPLIDGPWPLLQVWGEADEQVPAQAYWRFAARARQRQAPYCARPLSAAGHDLQSPARDGVQLTWGWVEQWMRSGQPWQCTAEVL